MYLKDMEWSEKHDVVLCREVLLMEPYQHPYTAISRKVVGKIAKVHATRSKGSMGRSIELLHRLNVNEI